MKNFIIFIALLLVLVPYVAFMDDNGKVSIASTVMKNDVEKAAQGAIMLFDADYYKEGQYVLNDPDILTYIDNQLGEKYKYTLYMYDQSTILRSYDNYSGTTDLTLSMTIELTDGKYVMEDLTGYNITIQDPSVIIVIEKEGEFYRVPLLQEKKIYRSSMYTADTRTHDRAPALGKLALWLPMNGDAKDYSGYNNHGIVNGATLTDGIKGQGYSFNGTSDYINCGNNINTSNPMSVAMWIKMDQYSTDGNTGGVLINNHTSLKGWIFSVVGNSTGTSGKLSYRAYDGSTSKSCTAVENLRLNQWYHVAATYDGHTMSIYVNGDLKNTAIFDNAVAPASSSMILGKASWYNGSYFDGTMDDVRIYNYALSKREISELSELAKSKILHYTFDVFQEPTVNLLYDNGIKNWTIRNLTVNTNVATVEVNQKYRITSTTFISPYTFGSFRLSVPVSKLSNGKTYNLSYKYRIIQGDKFEMMDWCDQTITRYTEDHGDYIFESAYGFRSEYTSTYRFMDFRMSENTIVEIWDIQLEEKNYPTPFVAGTREGTVRDISGYNHHATTELNSTPQWTADSKIGRGAFEFDGQTSYISVESLTSANYSNGVSFSCWAYPTASNSWARFMDFGNGNANNNLLFTRYGGTSTLDLHSYNGSSDSTLSAPGVIENNTWQHLAFTIDNEGTANIYKNGIVVATGVVNVPNLVDRTNNYIGKSNWAADSLYQGLMDDIQIYGYALNTDEIRYLYNQGAGKT